LSIYESEWLIIYIYIYKYIKILYVTAIAFNISRNYGRHYECFSITCNGEHSNHYDYIYIILKFLFNHGRIRQKNIYPQLSFNKIRYYKFNIGTPIASRDRSVFWTTLQPWKVTTNKMFINNMTNDRIHSCIYKHSFIRCIIVIFTFDVHTHSFIHSFLFIMVEKILSIFTSLLYLHCILTLIHSFIHSFLLMMMVKILAYLHPCYIYIVFWHSFIHSFIHSFS